MRGSTGIFAGVLLVLTVASAGAQVRLKDVAMVRDQQEIQIHGLGLVTGLDGTGDGKNTQFTVRMIANMMQKMGLDVPAASIKVRNVAAVMVTATVSPYTTIGGAFDVNVSSLGDAKGLEGGALLPTLLTDADGKVYGMAQGALSIGGGNRDYTGGGIVETASLVANVPAGGILQRQIETLAPDEHSLTVGLRSPDFTTAFRLAGAINDSFGDEIAIARDAGSVVVSVPDEYATRNEMVEFISQMEHVEFEPDMAAKVVINERTGTVIAGGTVSLAPVAIMHGTLSLTIGTEPAESVQNAASSNQGNTGDRMVVFGEAANVSAVAQSLNLLGVNPRDMIAIFQALKAAGSLRAELIIM